MYQAKVTRSQWRAWFAISLICALGVQFLPTPIAGADAPTDDYIVMFSDNADLQAKISKEARLGNSISQVYDNAASGFVAELDATDVRRLKADREVLVVELKAPRVKISPKEIGQVMKYAQEIEEMGVFPDRLNYKILLISSNFNKSANFSRTC